MDPPAGAGLLLLSPCEQGSRQKLPRSDNRICLEQLSADKYNKLY